MKFQIVKQAISLKKYILGFILSLGLVFGQCENRNVCVANIGYPMGGIELLLLPLAIVMLPLMSFYFAYEDTQKWAEKKYGKESLPTGSEESEETFQGSEKPEEEAAVEVLCNDGNPENNSKRTEE